jgi:tRNA(Ile2) C34 agmatinyltransferase TiaS
MSDIDHHYPAEPQCAKCGGQMKLIGRLPRRLHHPPRTVFRCSQCDDVVQE